MIITSKLKMTIMMTPANPQQKMGLIIRLRCTLHPSKITITDVIGGIFKPEGNALNFLLALKSGPSISANIEPEALELNAEEMAIVGRLPQGLKIEGVDLQKTVSGFFDNLFGASPSPLSSPASSSTHTTPSQRPRSFSVTDVLKNFSVEGNTFRLKRPLKSSSLDRSLSSAMSTASTEKNAFASQRLAMKMENGWLNLYLGGFNPENILHQFATDALVKQLQGN